MKEFPGERRAQAGNQFDGFHGLHASDGAGDGSHDAGLSGGGYCSGGGELRNHAVVAGASLVRKEDTELSRVLRDGANDHSFFQKEGGFIGSVP